MQKSIDDMINEVLAVKVEKLPKTQDFSDLQEVCASKLQKINKQMDEADQKLEETLEKRKSVEKREKIAEKWQIFNNFPYFPELEDLQEQYKIKEFAFSLQKEFQDELKKVAEQIF